jgi:hypothetical protein
MYTTAAFNSRKKVRLASADATLAAVSMSRLLRLAAGLCLLISVSSCAPPESPARVELRRHLQQEARLSDHEIGRLFDELSRTIEGKTVRLTDPNGTPVPDPAQQAEVFSMLRNRIGVFDEGLRTESATVYRVLNAPGKSDNAEIEASQRLWIDVKTLLPKRYEFTYAFQGYGDYAYGLDIEP